MSNIILDRDSFINEKYDKTSGNELNEGILDFFMNLGKNNWQKIKSKNPDIKKDLEQVDNNLEGFALTKIRKAGACNSVRQFICDFANALYDQKMQEYEDGAKLKELTMGLRDKDELSDEEIEKIEGAGKVPDYLKQFDIKDKAVADKLKNIDKNITSACNGDGEVQRWAELLKNQVRNLINDYIIDMYEKEKKGKKEEAEKWRKRVEKQESEEQKKQEEANKKAEKEQQDAIKEITKERTVTLTKAGVEIIKDKTGDKAVKTLGDSFKKFIEDSGLAQSIDKKILESIDKHDFASVIEESKKNKHKFTDKITSNMINAFKNDKVFGFNGLEKDKDINYGISRILVSEVATIYKAVRDMLNGPDYKESIKETPGDSIQALYVGLAKSVRYALLGQKIDDDTLNLLARCAIDKDKTLGYGIPKGKDGNLFVTLVKTLENPGKETKEIFTKFDTDAKEGEKLLSEFGKNLKSIFDEIGKKAEEIKEAAKKENEKKQKEVEKEAKEAAQEHEK